MENPSEKVRVLVADGFRCLMVLHPCSQSCRWVFRAGICESFCPRVAFCGLNLGTSTGALVIGENVSTGAVFHSPRCGRSLQGCSHHFPADVRDMERSQERSISSRGSSTGKPHRSYQELFTLMPSSAA
jgi:hypothetical protein